jgi:type VI secretion system Hcp family effector
MANSFMQVPDLPGLTPEEAKAWIPIKSISATVKVDSGKFEKGKPRVVGRSDHDELSVKKPLDRTSLALNMACCEARLIPAVNLAFKREDEKEIYLKCELRDVYIADMEISVDDGEAPEESLKLNFRSIEWKLRPKLKGDKLGDWVQVGWDRQEGRPTKGA